MKFIVESIQDDLVTLKTPNANYCNTFKFVGELPQVGTRVVGEVYANARKAESVSLGGNYVEPLFGRPRRMQGMVLEQNAQRNELRVQTGYEVTVKLPENQPATEFPVGSHVGWDNGDWPEFRPAAITAAV